LPGCDDKENVPLSDSAHTETTTTAGSEQNSLVGVFSVMCDLVVALWDSLLLGAMNFIAVSSSRRRRKITRIGLNFFI